MTIPMFATMDAMLAALNSGAVDQQRVRFERHETSESLVVLLVPEEGQRGAPVELYRRARLDDVVDDLARALGVTMRWQECQSEGEAA